MSKMARVAYAENGFIEDCEQDGRFIWGNGRHAAGLARVGRRLRHKSRAFAHSTPSCPTSVRLPCLVPPCAMASRNLSPDPSLRLSVLVPRLSALIPTWHRVRATGSCGGCGPGTPGVAPACAAR